MILCVFISSLAGFICRFSMIKTDYRMYPSYPQSYFSHLMLGFIASLLGSVFYPALLNKEYTAVSILAVAASQFREIRSVERDSLKALEKTELVARGEAYIEDVAKKFEARNYACMAVSLVCSASYSLALPYISITSACALSAVLATAIILLLTRFMRTECISDICSVRQADVYYKEQLLTVKGCVMMNNALDSARKIITENALGIIITPNDKKGSGIISNLGQRQAILHNICAKAGIRKDEDEPDFTPLARRVSETGEIAIVFMPAINDIELVKTAIKETPVLESAKH